jgi:hypothetical protein
MFGVAERGLHISAFPGGPPCNAQPAPNVLIGRGEEGGFFSGFSVAKEGRFRGALGTSHKNRSFI